MASLAFLDATGAYYAGRKADRDPCIRFVASYLKCPDDFPTRDHYGLVLYDGVRSALLHNFNVRGLVGNRRSPDISLAELRQAHHSRASDGTLTLVPDCFAEDVVNALDRYENDLSGAKSQVHIALARTVLGIHKPLEVRVDPLDAQVQISGVFGSNLSRPFWTFNSQK